ncbi:MAG: hypothetical protein FRX48_00495 [Lasallia pustulata]|uniref:Uncharacterized protein n=1 Tax=Lasallia pustulata TaxID=136370 RepID=A0A5M8Q324_9LECA|nr:MAG: hypothetical protein FRX48_00495 [Lasallia pustulata]
MFGVMVKKVGPKTCIPSAGHPFCDWNVRAWTMLEATRGSRAIHLQCKDDRTISLTDILRKVHQEGAIDLAVLREDDEVVIWSPLNNRPGKSDVLKLWESQGQVNTAFLMSSAPRITTPSGYSWPPVTPYTRPQPRSADLGSNIRQYYTVRYPSYDGQGSFVARINTNPAGLISKWLVWDMDSETLSTYREEFYHRNKWSAHLAMNPHIHPGMDVYEQRDTAAACDLIAKFLNSGGKVRVLRPLAEDGITPYEGGSDRGEQYGLRAAICISGDDGEAWKWQGVFQWLESASAPRMGGEGDAHRVKLP